MFLIFSTSKYPHNHNNLPKPELTHNDVPDAFKDQNNLHKQSSFIPSCTHNTDTLFLFDSKQPHKYCFWCEEYHSYDWIVWRCWLKISNCFWGCGCIMQIFLIVFCSCHSDWLRLELLFWSWICGITIMVFLGVWGAEASRSTWL